jgi:hypothetical protein
MHVSVRSLLYIPNAQCDWPLRTAELLALDDGLVAATGLGDLAAAGRPHHRGLSGPAVEQAAAGTAGQLWASAYKH